MLFHIVGGETNCPVRGNFWSRSRHRSRRSPKSEEQRYRDVNYEGINVEDDRSSESLSARPAATSGRQEHTPLPRAQGSGHRRARQRSRGHDRHRDERERLCRGRKDPFEYAEKAAKANKKFAVKAGFIDGSAVDAPALTRLPSCPARKCSLRRFSAAINARIQGFVNVMSGKIAAFAVALNAIPSRRRLPPNNSPSELKKQI